LVFLAYLNYSNLTTSNFNLLPWQWSYILIDLSVWLTSQLRSLPTGCRGFCSAGSFHTRKKAVWRHPGQFSQPRGRFSIRKCEFPKTYTG